MSEAASAPRRGLSKRREWIIVGVSALVLALAVVTPVVMNAVAHASAVSAYRAAVSTAADAAGSAAKAAGELAAISSTGVSDADALRAIVDQTPVELVADPATRDAAAAAVAQLRSSASAPAIDVPAIAEWGALGESASTEDLNSAASTAASYTSTATDLATQATTAQVKISDDLAAAQAAVDGLVVSAAAKGATLVYDRAGDGEKQALGAAVAALQARKAGVDRPSTADTAGLVGAYVAAVNAARVSQDAVVAAEQAAAQQAAEDAAREAQSYQSSRGSSSGSGGSGGSGSDSGGSSGRSSGWDGTGMGAPLEMHCNGCVAGKNVWE